MRSHAAVYAGARCTGRHTVNVVRIARQIRIKVHSQTDAHAEAYRVSVMMEHVRPRRTSSLRRGGGMSADVAPIRVIINRNLVLCYRDAVRGCVR